MASFPLALFWNQAERMPHWVKHHSNFRNELSSETAANAIFPIPITSVISSEDVFPYRHCAGCPAAFQIVKNRKSEKKDPADCPS
jgi:hypothetical protein